MGLFWVSIPANILSIRSPGGVEELVVYSGVCHKLDTGRHPQISEAGPTNIHRELRPVQKIPFANVADSAQQSMSSLNLKDPEPSQAEVRHAKS